MIELRTLGGLELLQAENGNARAIPLQSKRLALLAYLASAPPNSFRRRDTLIGLFWPELDQEHARGALRQAIHFIRKGVGDRVIVTRGEEEVGLDRSVLASDAGGLEAALAAGTPEVALSIYRGDFLDGVFVADAAPELEDWIAAERVRLRGLAAKAAWLASERPSTTGDTGEFVRRAVALSGDDETALRRGIAQLERRGDRVGAAALYEEFSARVARDLDIELSPETQQAMQAVRARPSTPPALERPPGAPARPSVGFSNAEGGSRTAKKLWVSGAGGALCMLALAFYVGSDRASAANSDVVAVVPFRVVDADSSLSWLHDGIVELLTVRLAGDGGLRLADPARVLAEWNRKGMGGRLDAPDEAVKAVADRIGAQRIIQGSVTGTSRRITLTGRLSPAAGSGSAAHASVEGSPDSLPQLIDQLAAQLLSLSAGLERAQLASLTSRSLPAIRAFLNGQSAFRSGRMELAVQWFREATMLDSTFALAGLQLARASMWSGTDADAERGYHLAAAGRDRLSPADRLLLDVSTTPEAGSSKLFADWNAAVSALPNRPEVWYTLGDIHYHWGRLAGEEDALERAAVAFRRGWMLDSLAGTGAAGGPPIAEPTEHIVALAHLAHDTAEVLRLVSSVLQVDSTGNLAHLLMWHRASVTGDSARRAYWARIGSVDEDVLKNISLFIIWSGVGTEDLARVTAEDARRLRAHDPGWATFAFTAGALNGGRPEEVPKVGPAPGIAGHRLLRARIRRALAWDGDTAEAVAAARALGALADAAPAHGDSALAQLYDICALGEWRGSRGDAQYAAVASRRLRSARPMGRTSTDSAEFTRFVSLCGSLLDAMHASGLRLPGARASVAAADSTARELIFQVCCGEIVNDVNAQLVRLWEREGDSSRALAAARRRTGGFGIAPYYISTYLREEGRLALAVGDTAGAVRAYRHYLALRPDPEPALRPGVDSVRQALAVLETH